MQGGGWVMEQCASEMQRGRSERGGGNEAGLPHHMMMMMMMACDAAEERRSARAPTLQGCERREWATAM